MRVLIVDENWMTRLGLGQFLSSLDSDTQIIEASTLDEGVRLIRGRIPCDLCLIDFSLKGVDPLTALRQIHRAAPSVGILVVTTVASRRLALDAVEEGASGYVLKSSTPNEFKRAIRRIREGDIWLPAGLRDTPIESVASPSEQGDGTPPLHTNASFSSLTPRQRQVLNLVARGMRNVDIAKSLGISPRTVQIHVSTILKLLKVSNRTAAALLAHDRNPAA